MASAPRSGHDCAGLAVRPSRCQESRRTHSEVTVLQLVSACGHSVRFGSGTELAGWGRRPAVGRSAGEAGVGCAVAWGPERGAGGDASRAPAPAGSRLCHLELGTRQAIEVREERGHTSDMRVGTTDCACVCEQSQRVELQPGVERTGRESLTPHSSRACAVAHRRHPLPLPTVIPRSCRSGTRTPQTRD